MKKLIALAIAAASFCAVAETNVVTYTAEQAQARQKRVAEWREKWAKMTLDERKAHREEQKRKIAEARRQELARTGRKEVERKQDADGNITIRYSDGSVLIHRFSGNSAK